MKAVILRYGDTPPSLNTIATRGNRWAVTRAKQRWEGIFMVLLMEKSASYNDKLPKRLARVQATAMLRFPTRHRRDEGNYRWMLEKALGDALQKGGYLADDTPEFYTFQSLAFDPERGKPETRILLGYEC